MSATTSTSASTAGRVLPLNDGSLLQRAVRGAVTPGGAVFILLAVLFVAVVWVNPSFGEPPQLIRFIGRTAPIAIAAMGQYYVIVSGEFDLSMGAVIATQVVIAGNYIGEDESRVLPALALMLLIGAVVGLVNGLATTLLRVPSFIVTLGTMLALGGLVRYLTGGAATGNPVDSFREIGRGGLQDVPVLDVLAGGRVGGVREVHERARVEDRRQRQAGHRPPPRRLVVPELGGGEGRPDEEVEHHHDQVRRSPQREVVGGHQPGHPGDGAHEVHHAEHRQEGEQPRGARDVAVAGPPEQRLHAEAEPDHARREAEGDDEQVVGAGLDVGEEQVQAVVGVVGAAGEHDRQEGQPELPAGSVLPVVLQVEERDRPVAEVDEAHRQVGQRGRDRHGRDLRTELPDAGCRSGVVA